MSTLNWIPVTERLPDAETTVIVWTKAGEWWSAWYDDDAWKDAANGDTMAGDNAPTHWAEPEGPTP